MHKNVTWDKMIIKFLVSEKNVWFKIDNWHKNRKWMMANTNIHLGESCSFWRTWWWWLLVDDARCVLSSHCLMVCSWHFYWWRRQWHERSNIDFVVVVRGERQRWLWLLISCCWTGGSTFARIAWPLDWRWLFSTFVLCVWWVVLLVVGEIGCLRLEK